MLELERLASQKLRVREQLLSRLEEAAGQLRNALRREGVTDIIDSILEGISLLKQPEDWGGQGRP